MVPWLRKQVDWLTSASLLFGALTGGIVLFGGHFPPWQSVQAAADEATNAATIQGHTVDTLNKLNDKIDAVAKRVDQGNCSALNVTLLQANAALLKAPNDPLARALHDGTLAQMHTISGCTTY